MKLWKYIKIVSLLLVVYAFGAQPVFATTRAVSPTLSQGSVSKLDHSEKAALFFEEVSVSDVNSPEFEHKFHGFGSGVSNFSCDFSGAAVQFQLINTLRPRDKRKLIAASIFPFHFFW